MIYSILESGIIRGGTLTIDLNLLEDVYEANYSLDVKLGKKIFGRWVPLPGFSKSGSVRIDKQYLSEDFIKANDSFTVNGKTFQKEAYDLLSVATDGIVIQIGISYDGNDPVEITSIATSFGSYNITAIKS